VKYVRRNFVCGRLGREPSCLMDFNTELRQWVNGVANQRVHGTTREQVLARWEVDRFSMPLVNGRPAYLYSDDELRKVARDAYVSWQASRYWVLWQYVGQEVWVRPQGVDVEVHHGGQRVAVHSRAERRHQIITYPPHHEGIPLGFFSFGIGFSPMLILAGSRRIICFTWGINVLDELLVVPVRFQGLSQRKRDALPDNRRRVI
jgi:hypothetical protein